MAASLTLLTNRPAPEGSAPSSGQSLSKHEQSVLCGSVVKDSYRSVDTVDESRRTALTLTLPFVDNITVQILGVQLEFARDVDTRRVSYMARFLLRMWSAKSSPRSRACSRGRSPNRRAARARNALASIFDTGG